VPWNINEISDLCNAKKNEISNVYIRIISEFDIKIPSSDPLKYLIRKANISSLSNKSAHISLKITRWVINNTSNDIFGGKNHIIISAAVIYYIGLYKIIKESILLRRIAFIIEISELSVRNRISELTDILSESLFESMI
jgi:transcription initiation factor TFIIIB Brf1 subunit/transcription initiation factor TFIIB